MLRSAAKSFKDVVVISDIKDYELVKEEMNKFNEVSYITRKKLAGKVFNLTSAYDAAISQFLLDEDFPEDLFCHLGLPGSGSARQAPWPSIPLRNAKSH